MTLGHMSNIKCNHCIQIQYSIISCHAIYNHIIMGLCDMWKYETCHLILERDISSVLVMGGALTETFFGDTPKSSLECSLSSRAMFDKYSMERFCWINNSACLCADSKWVITLPGNKLYYVTNRPSDDYRVDIFCLISLAISVFKLYSLVLDHIFMVWCLVRELRKVFSNIMDKWKYTLCNVYQKLISSHNMYQSLDVATSTIIYDVVWARMKATAHCHEPRNSLRYGLCLMKLHHWDTSIGYHCQTIMLVSIMESLRHMLWESADLSGVLLSSYIQY